jgi:hypothetical protein
MTSEERAKNVQDEDGRLATPKPYLPSADSGYPAPAAAPVARQELEQVPVMPVIGPAEQIQDSMYPLLDGISPMVGWRFRSKGDPAFMIMRRTGFGSRKVLESFPLTEDGWGAAWQSLVRQNPAAIPRVLAELEAREERQRARDQRAALAAERERLREEHRLLEQQWLAASSVKLPDLGVTLWEGAVYAYYRKMLGRMLGPVTGAHVEVVTGPSRERVRSAGRRLNDTVADTLLFGPVGLLSAYSGPKFLGVAVFTFPDGSFWEKGLPDKPALARARAEAVRFNAMAGKPAEDAAQAGEGVAAELERLTALHDSGALDDEEFRAAKARIIHGGSLP